MIGDNSAYIFNVFHKRLNKIKFEILPFRTFYHLFYCSRGLKSVNKCSYGTRFFIDGHEIARYLDRSFKYHVDGFKYTDLENILPHVNSHRFRFSLYYIISDFAKTSNIRNKNYYSLIVFKNIKRQVHFVFDNCFLPYDHLKNILKFIKKEWFKRKKFPDFNMNYPRLILRLNGNMIM